MINNHRQGPALPRRTVLGAGLAGMGLAAIPALAAGEVTDRPRTIPEAVDALDFTRPDLIIATFFTASTEPASETDPRRPIDRRIGVYAANASSPEQFTYLGETGLAGRDSSLTFQNGMFYVLSTADQQEQFAMNIYKSPDLLEWTGAAHCRYEIHTTEPKREGTVYNWGPKWIEDTIAGTADDPRRYAILSLESTHDRLTEGLLPFSPYPIMNTYIVPVDGWADPDREDLDRKTLTLSTPTRVNWGEGEGLSYKIVNGVRMPISRIGAYVDIDRTNKDRYGYRYLMFVKVDPWGDIELWGSDDLLTAEPWTRLKPWLRYSGTEVGEPPTMIEEKSGELKIRRMFEGNYPIHLPERTVLYTDNYVYKATAILTDGGMYSLSCDNYLDGFDYPAPLAVANTEERPQDIQSYVTRNGSVKHIPDRGGRAKIEQFATSRVFYSTTAPTTDPVRVIIRANDPLAAVPGWEPTPDHTRLIKTFTSNATEEVALHSAAGADLGIVTVTVTNLRDDPAH